MWWEPVSEIVFGFTIVLLLAGLIIFARRNEKKKWNNGVCLDCEVNLTLPAIMVDSQGGRGWTCPKCGRTVWVSYNVDKKAI